MLGVTTWSSNPGVTAWSSNLGEMYIYIYIYIPFLVSTNDNRAGPSFNGRSRLKFDSAPTGDSGVSHRLKLVSQNRI